MAVTTNLVGWCRTIYICAAHRISSIMSSIKKTSLRSKLTKRTTRLVALKIQEFHAETDPVAHENPLLKLATASKKEKRQQKLADFATRMLNKVTFNTGSGISKSLARRQRRKQNEQLKPNMNELLTALDGPAVSVTTSAFVKLSAPERNTPNVTKQSGRKQIMDAEGQQFKRVLQNEAFRQLPFAALRATIELNRN